MLIFSMLGIAIVLVSLAAIFNGVLSLGWPSVRGSILELRISGEKFNNRPTYSNYIEYEYFVDGIRYIGNRQYWLGINIGTEHQKARNKFGVYKEGMVVRVFYDPESPSDAVLEPGIHSDVLFGLFVGVIFSMFGFGVLWIDNRNIKNDI